MATVGATISHLFGGTDGVTPEVPQQLDWTFVAPWLAIISSPFENESLSLLRAFLAAHYRGKTKIFDLTDEDDLRVEQDLPDVITCPLASGTAAPMTLLIRICSAIEAHMQAIPNGLVVLHCRYGGGRSAMVAAAALLHRALVTTASSAVEYIRFNRPQAKMTPSQVRAVYYYDQLLRTDNTTPSSATNVSHIGGAISVSVPDGIPQRTLQLLSVRVITIPQVNNSILNAGCTPYLDILVAAKQTEWSYTYRRSFHQLSLQNMSSLPTYTVDSDTEIEFDMSQLAVLLRGDVVLSISSQGQKVAQIGFNTSFLPIHRLTIPPTVSDVSPTMSGQVSSSDRSGEYVFACFDKPLVDLACNDSECRTFSPGFAVQLLLRPHWRDEDSINTPLHTSSDSDTAHNRSDDKFIMPPNMAVSISDSFFATK